MASKMRTVTGSVISSETISVSKGSSILSKFVSAENGVSEIMLVYLRRTLASFKELKRLHKDKSSRSHHKRKRTSSDFADEAHSEPNLKRHRR